MVSEHQAPGCQLMAKPDASHPRGPVSYAGPVCVSSAPIPALCLYRKLNSTIMMVKGPQRQPRYSADDRAPAAGVHGATRLAGPGGQPSCVGGEAIRRRLCFVSSAQGIRVPAIRAGSKVTRRSRVWPLTRGLQSSIGVFGDQEGAEVAVLRSCPDDSGGSRRDRRNAKARSVNQQVLILVVAGRSAGHGGLTSRRYKRSGHFPKS
jgi:hypothetical protein